MKRIPFLLLLVFAISTPVWAQMDTTPSRIVPKDSLPDLWVVSFDTSGSMLDRRIRSNLYVIPDMLNSLIASHGNKNKDRFLLLKSGASIKKLVEDNRNANEYTDMELVSYLIHDDGSIMDFFGMLKKVRQLCGSDSDFKYDMSFTSLVRPLSVYLTGKNGKVDFAQYNRIFHILITDDGDINDQWLQDYKWMKKWAHKNFACYNRILPSVATSEFDFTARKTGKFVEIETLDQTQPHIYLTQYVTYEEGNPEKVSPIDSLLTIADFHKDSIIFAMKPCGDRIGFVYIDSCRINGHGIVVGRHIYPGNSVKVEYPKEYRSLFGNTISVKGQYQEQYDDDVLGKRARTVDIDDDFDITYITNEIWVGISLIAVVLILLLILLAAWHNMVVVRIYVDGRCMSIKRKAMMRLRNDDYVLATVVGNNDNVSKSFFYTGRGITIADDGTIKTGEPQLIIKSFKGLAPTYHGVLVNADSRGKRIEITSDFSQNNMNLQFQYANRLSHNLVINFVTEDTDPLPPASANQLREYNLRMLANYYEENATKIRTIHNNVMVNIISRNELKENCGCDYAVLNIFDLYSGNACDRIYLRYSLTCSFDAGTMSNADATARLLQVAKHVLRSERCRPGYIENEVRTDVPASAPVIRVDVSPLLSYLYLLNLSRGKKSRLVYSPFADGRNDLTTKTVRLYHNEGMCLLNLPIRYPRPHEERETLTKIELKSPKRITSLHFDGSDIVRLLEDSLDCAYGKIVQTYCGMTFFSWDINSKLFRIN